MYLCICWTRICMTGANLSLLDLFLHSMCLKAVLVALEATMVESSVWVIDLCRLLYKFLWRKRGGLECWVLSRKLWWICILNVELCNVYNKPDTKCIYPGLHIGTQKSVMHTIPFINVVHNQRKSLTKTGSFNKMLLVEYNQGHFLEWLPNNC